MFDDLFGQELGIGRAVGITSIVQVRLASDTSNHHRLHIPEPGPVTADGVDQTPDIRARPCQDVLVEDEKWLYGANVSP